MTCSTLTELTAFVTDAVVPHVNALRALQDPSGRLVGDLDIASSLLNSLRAPVREAYTMAGAPTTCADAFEADLDLWLARGLNSIPQFDHTVVSFVPPSQHMPTFFIGPLVTPNGLVPRGSFLECFLAYREEPEELHQVSIQMPHPKNSCQSTRLLTASSGLLTGNCIVFFPENVATAEKVKSQTFALFFFNKFQHIYLVETMSRVRQLFGEREWASAQMLPADCYRARCLWGYLHDYFHHCGPRPLDTHLQVKMNFFVGLLEELKVDCQSAVVAHKGDVPFGQQIVEFIVFERLLRYTGQPNATTNFDAGTGFFLFEWLLQNGYGLRAMENGLDIDLDGCVDGMSRLARDIEAIEAAATDETSYRCLAKDFVRAILPEGPDKARFSIPSGFARLAQVGTTTTTASVLSFADLPY